MRILFVHDRLGAHGGAEANILATATALAGRGHAVALAHGAATGREEAAWHDAFPARWPLTELAAALRWSRPDAVFVHKCGEPGALGTLASAGVPVARMVHDHELYCLRGYKYHPWSRAACRRPSSAFCVFPCGGILRRGTGGRPLGWASPGARRRELAWTRSFARVVVASAFMRGELLRNGFDPARVEVHPPVPPPVAPAFRPTFGGRDRLVYAGQLVRGKGVDVLLESLARVRWPFEALILGDGSHRPACEKLARRLGLEGRVRFGGFVPPSGVAEACREATASLMSSVWPEPFGLTGLEALRCGLPVVAFDAGGIGEWLRDGQDGFLVPWMDRDRYAAAVETLLADRELARRLGENGRRHAEEHFGFPAYIDGLERLFLNLVGQPPPATLAIAA